jgi:drug/metabolite transporter (DMT)-like permease
MVLEYFLIIFATVLFSVQFLFTKKYQLCVGSGASASFFHKAIAPIAFAVVLTVYSFITIPNFKIEITWFSFLLSLCMLGVTLTLSLLSLKVLAKGSVANYGLYLLSGGMIVPVVFGFFIGDSFGVWKILSILCILGAILVKFNFNEKLDFKSYVFLVGLFILNGLSGVVSTIHSQDVFGLGLSVTPQSFSIVNLFLGSIAGFVLFAIIAIKNRKEIKLKPFLKAIPWSLAEGVCNGLGNFLLLLALLKVDASMQYPIVTGGCIFLSAILPLIIYKEKIDWKGWVSVALAVVGSIVIIL